MNHLLKTLAIGLLFGANFSQAQTAKIELGIEGGPNVSPFLENKAYKNNDHMHSAIQPRYASSLGFSFQWNSQKSFSLRTGIAFEQNNYSYSTNYSDIGTTQGGQGKGSAHFEYVKLPVLARFTYGQKVRFFFNVGAFFSILTNQRERTEGTNYMILGGNLIGSTYKNEFSNLSMYKKIDFGVVGGLGIGIPVKKRWYFSLEARDNFGINNILLKNSYSRSLRTNSLNLLVGVSYKLSFREEKK
jgi:hypothetical protein